MPERKKALLLLAMLGAVGAFYALGGGSRLTFGHLKHCQTDLLAWRATAPGLTAAAYVGLYAATTALSLPGAALLTLAGGAVFGFWQGLVLASCASTLGATGAFLLSRTLLGDTVRARLGARLATVDRGIAREGAFYLFTLRLVPVLPFWLINLAMGLTPLPTRTFVWVSQVGMLAGTAVYVNAGTRLGELETPGGLVSAPLLASFAALGLSPWVARGVVGWLRTRRGGAPMKRPAGWKFAAAAAVLGVLTTLSWALGRPSVPPVPPEPPMGYVEPDDESFSRTLARFVTPEGRVDYAGLVAEPDDLDAWYRSVAWLDPAALAGWDEPTRIAFWCNVYNGLTLLAIRENHPIPRSISGTLTGAPAGSIRQLAGVWSDLAFQAVGESITLDEVEHDILRTRFQEPRIHMAINCASVGCPVLRPEPYDGQRLDAQLGDQTRRMVSSADRFAIDRDAGVVRLSKIFSWFGGDFPAPASGFGSHPDATRGPLTLLARYVEPPDAAWLAAGDYRVELLPYDWHLNDVPR